MVNYAERVAKGTFIVFAMLFISGILGYALRIFMARSLSLGDYGLFYSVFVFITFPMLFRDMGLNSALGKFIPEFLVERKFANIRASIEYAVKIETVVSLAIIAIIFFSRNLIAEHFFRNQSAAVLITPLLVFFFVHMFFQIFKSAFQGFQDMKLFALSEVIYIASILASIGILFSFSPSPEYAAWGYVAGTAVVSAVCGILVCRSLAKLPVEGKSENGLEKKLMTFSIPVMLTGTASLALGYVDTLCITFFRPIDEVGLYQVALPTSQIMLYLSSALIAILFPVIAEMWARKKYRSVSGGTVLLIKFMFIGILPLGMIMLAFPEIVLNILFGPIYIGASPALQILGIGFVFYTLGSILATVINGIGKPIVNTKIVFVVSLVNIAANILLVPFYGITGSATATMVSYVLYFCLSRFFLGKELEKINVRLYIPRLPVIKIIAGSLVSLTIILLMKNALIMDPMMEMAIILPAAFVFYAVWILFSRCLDKEDVKMIKKINAPIPNAFMLLLEKNVK